MTVNDVVVRELGRRADAVRDRIAVDGQPIRVGVRRTVVLHKPRGVVATLDDPEGRPTVAEVVRDSAERLYPIGRLDVNTTGLLLMTNDGALANALAHPRAAVPRVYRAKVRGAPDAAAIDRLRRGIRLDEGKTPPARVRMLERLPTKSWLELTVRVGWSHVVRRMCAAVGHPVEKLARVRFGPVTLGTLPQGAWRPVTPREEAALAAAAGLRRGDAATGRERRAPDRRPRRRRPRSGRSPGDEGRSGKPAAPAAPARSSRRPPTRPRP